MKEKREEIKMSNKISVILDLFNQGFKMIELYGINEQGNCTCYKGSECNCAGKHPVKPKWQENYIKSVDELTEILKQRPLANFGIITGEGLVVIDVDARHGGLESLQEIKDLVAPTMTVKTGGGGYHFYYSVDGSVKNRTNVLKGIDVRGDGGYVVAPGSKHKSGDFYIIEKEEK